MKKTKNKNDLTNIAIKEYIVDGKFNWKLVREDDGLVKTSKNIMWIEFDENGRFKAKHNDIAVGRSLLMSPFNVFYAWQTTTVSKIIEQKECYIKFHTQNSTYELFCIK